jgi:hypothetical protein
MRAALFATAEVVLQIRHAFHPALAADAGLRRRPPGNAPPCLPAPRRFLHRRSRRVTLLWAARRAGRLLVG